MVPPDASRCSPQRFIASFQWASSDPQQVGNIAPGLHFPRMPRSAIGNLRRGVVSLTRHEQTAERRTARRITSSVSANSLGLELHPAIALRSSTQPANLPQKEQMHGCRRMAASSRRASVADRLDGLPSSAETSSLAVAFHLAWSARYATAPSFGSTSTSVCSAKWFGHQLAFHAKMSSRASPRRRADAMVHGGADPPDSATALAAPARQASGVGPDALSLQSLTKPSTSPPERHVVVCGLGEHQQAGLSTRSDLVRKKHNRILAGSHGMVFGPVRPLPPSISPLGIDENSYICRRPAHPTTRRHHGAVEPAPRLKDPWRPRRRFNCEAHFRGRARSSARWSGPWASQSQPWCPRAIEELSTFPHRARRPATQPQRELTALRQLRLAAEHRLRRGRPLLAFRLVVEAFRLTPSRVSTWPRRRPVGRALERPPLGRLTVGNSRDGGVRDRDLDPLRWTAR